MNRTRILIGSVVLIVLTAGGALWANYGTAVFIRGFGGWMCG